MSHVKQEMAVQIVAFYQNENIIYTVFAYQTMYLNCMVRIFFFLKKEVLNKSDTDHWSLSSLLYVYEANWNICQCSNHFKEDFLFFNWMFT